MNLTESSRQRSKHHERARGARAGGRRLNPVAAAVLAGCTLATAHAQQADETKADAQLEVVTVSARRIKEKLQDAPVSVQSLSGGALETQRLNDIVQLAVSVPSLAVGADNSLSLRGVGSQVFTANVDSSVGVAVDEVSLGVPLYMSRGILDDIDRVEVLSGPQGILFGRNTSAGLLNVQTRRPDLHEFYGKLSAEFDYRDTLPGANRGYIQKLMLNAPVSESSALRVNALNYDQDAIAQLVSGSPKRIDQSQKRQAARLKYLVQPSGKLQIYAIGDYSRETGIGANLDRTVRSFAPGSPTQPILASVGVTAGPENFSYAADGDMALNLSTGGTSLNLSYELSDSVTLTNITAWRFYKLDLALDTDNTAKDIFNTNVLKESYDQYSNELRMTFRPDKRLDGQVGLYVFQATLDRESQLGGNLFRPTPPAPIIANFGNHAIGTQENRSYAAFGQLNFHPSDAATVFGGVRYTRDEVSVDGVSTTEGYLAPFRPVGKFAAKVPVNNVSWKAGAQVSLAKNAMVYASYGTGYKGPTYNSIGGLSEQQLSVGPEKVRDLELGIKSELLDRRLRVNLSAFNMTFDNFQTNAFQPALNAFVLQNAAKVNSSGIEASISARPIPALILNANATYLDSTFDDFPGAPCQAGQTEPSTCKPTGGTYNAAGHRTPGSARLSASLQAIYKFALPGEWNAAVEANYFHRSAVNYDASNLPWYSVPAVDVIGASVAFHFRDWLELGIFCKNCTNQVYPTAVSGVSVDNVIAHVPSMQQQWGYNSVRTLGVSIGVSF